MSIIANNVLVFVGVAGRVRTKGNAIATLCLREIVH